MGRDPDRGWHLLGRITRGEWIVAAVVAVTFAVLILLRPDILEAPDPEPAHDRVHRRGHDPGRHRAGGHAPPGRPPGRAGRGARRPAHRGVDVADLAVLHRRGRRGRVRHVDRRRVGRGERRRRCRHLRPRPRRLRPSRRPLRPRRRPPRPPRRRTRSSSGPDSSKGWRVTTGPATPASSPSPMATTSSASRTWRSRTDPTSSCTSFQVPTCGHWPTVRSTWAVCGATWATRPTTSPTSSSPPPGDWTVLVWCRAFEVEFVNATLRLA